MHSKSAKLIIHGITREGKKFRPSDWAQRLTTAVASYGPGRRIKFHPKVRMATLDGINCVVIMADLEESDPMLFEFLINFGKENHLELIESNVFPPLKTTAA